MATKWNEGAITRVIGQQTLNKKCMLLVDRCNWTGYECDVLGVTNDLRVIDIEVKISRADFKVDAKKDKWWHKDSWWTEPVGEKERVHRDWPPKVWKHYYAMPADIWSDDLFSMAASPASGVLLVRERWSGRLDVECIRRSKPNKDATRLTPAQVIDIARLANLRMWDAYERSGRLGALSDAE